MDDFDDDEESASDPPVAKPNINNGSTVFMVSRDNQNSGVTLVTSNFLRCQGRYCVA